MDDTFNDRRKVLEESYFEKVNAEALQRIKNRQTGDRKSPITGKPMKQEVCMGVAIDRCVDSGGMWLDAGELDQIVENITSAAGDKDGILRKLLKGFTGTK